MKTVPFRGSRSHWLLLATTIYLAVLIAKRWRLEVSGKWGDYAIAHEQHFKRNRPLWAGLYVALFVLLAMAIPNTREWFTTGVVHPYASSWMDIHFLLARHGAWLKEFVVIGLLVVLPMALFLCDGKPLPAGILVRRTLRTIAILAAMYLALLPDFQAKKEYEQAVSHKPSPDDTERVWRLQEREFRSQDRIQMAGVVLRISTTWSVPGFLLAALWQRRARRNHLPSDTGSSESCWWRVARPTMVITLLGLTGLQLTASHFNAVARVIGGSDWSAFRVIDPSIDLTPKRPVLVLEDCASHPAYRTIAPWQTKRRRIEVTVRHEGSVLEYNVPTVAIHGPPVPWLIFEKAVLDLTGGTSNTAVLALADGRLRQPIPDDVHLLISAWEKQKDPAGHAHDYLMHHAAVANRLLEPGWCIAAFPEILRLAGPWLASNATLCAEVDTALRDISTFHADRAEITRWRRLVALSTERRVRGGDCYAPIRADHSWQVFFYSDALSLDFGLTRWMWGSSPAATRTHIDDAFRAVLKTPDKSVPPGYWFRGLARHVSRWEHNKGSFECATGDDPLAKRILVSTSLDEEPFSVGMTDVQHFQLLAMRVHLAVLRYERDHGGQPPNNLTQLTPTYFNVVPEPSWREVRYKSFDTRDVVKPELGFLSEGTNWVFFVKSPQGKDSDHQPQKMQEILTHPRDRIWPSNDDETPTSFDREYWDLE